MAERNYDELASKLFQKLENTGWDKLMEDFIPNQEFRHILEILDAENSSGKPFTPPLKNIFKCFQATPLPNAKVVIVGMDPYPQPGIATGIAFDCAENTIQKSLQIIHEEIDQKVYPFNHGRVFNNDLSYLTEQGVVLLNAALTTQVSDSGTHGDLWKPFMVHLFKKLNEQKGMIFIFMGSKSRELSLLLDSQNHKKFIVSHPASSAYKGTTWETGDTFENVNKILEEQGKSKIKW